MKNETQTLYLEQLEGLLWIEIEELFHQGEYSKGYQQLEEAIEEYTEIIDDHNQQLDQLPKQRYRKYLNNEPTFLLTIKINYGLL